VNGELFEFKTVVGNARTLEWEFRSARRKGDDINVFIVISWRGGKPHFEDTYSFR
jgi:hypothetical protein